MFIDLLYFGGGRKSSSWRAQLVIFTAVVTVAYGLFDVVKNIWRGFPSFAVHQPSCSLYTDNESNDRADYDGHLLSSVGLFYFFFLLLVFLLYRDSLLFIYARELLVDTHLSLRFSILIYTTRTPIQIKRWRSYDFGAQPRRNRKNRLFTWPILSRLSKHFTLGIQTLLPLLWRKVEFSFSSRRISWTNEEFLYSR